LNPRGLSPTRFPIVRTRPGYATSPATVIIACECGSFKCCESALVMGHGGDSGLRRGILAGWWCEAWVAEVSATVGGYLLQVEQLVGWGESVRASRLACRQLLDRSGGGELQQFTHGTPLALVAVENVGSAAPEIHLSRTRGGELDQAASHPYGHLVS
jgi:hypothetical protein